MVTDDDDVVRAAGTPTGEIRQAARLGIGALYRLAAMVQEALGHAPDRSAPAWDFLVGAGVVAAEGLADVRRVGGVVLGPVVNLAARPPFLPSQYQPARWVEALAQRGHQETLSGERDVERLIGALVPLVVNRVLEQIDLTAVVKEHVDIDAIVAEVDVNAIAARLDIDAVIARVDLVGLAEGVIEAIDLPEIIRESTGSMRSEAIRDVRMQSIEADEAVSRIVDRLFLRRRKRITNAPGEPLSLLTDALRTQREPEESQEKR